MEKPPLEPLIVMPTSTHTQTIILLHGRGSNAQRFAFDKSTIDKPGILECKNSSGYTLPQLFPGMKFVFPTAPRRRCTARKRNAMRIWFDNSSFEDPFEREELQIDGLAENFQLISEIVRKEAQILSLKQVFLAGLSQGYAMAIYMLLGFDADAHDSDVRFGGFIGMSGWLPFQSTIDQILLSNINEDEFAGENPFASDIDQEANEEDNITRVTRFVREEILGRSVCELSLLVSPRTPIFLGHGDQDDTVKLRDGKSSFSALKSLGLDVSWKVYEQQGHWYSVPDSIDDIAAFLERNAIT